jgi:hypothetical protein
MFCRMQIPDRIGFGPPGEVNYVLLHNVFRFIGVFPRIYSVVFPDTNAFFTHISRESGRRRTWNPLSDLAFYAFALKKHVNEKEFYL